MANKVKLFLDLDGTLAEWRAAASYEDLFKAGYFATLDAHEPVIQAVARLHKEDTVEPYILSAYLVESRYALQEKAQWVSEHVPYVSTEHRLFVPQNVSKSDYVAALVGSLDASCVLLDDYSKNLHDWAAAGGTGIKLLNGINGRVGTWRGAAVSRFDSQDAIYSALRALIL